MALLAAEGVGHSGENRETEKAIVAIAGQLMGYRTLADGTLRLTVDLSEVESRNFHKLFEVHMQVAVAPMDAVAMQRAIEDKHEQDYGNYARALRLSIFFGIPEVWKATGSDEQFLAFVRTQKCIARSGEPCHGDVIAAHVWRLRDGFGKGVKGPYAAVPLCDYHHRLQHNNGEKAIGGRAYMEKAVQGTRVAWVWSEIKDDIGVASMRDADPKKVYAWCERRNIAHHLPAAFKELT